MEPSAGPGPVALVGSGEYLPVLEPLEKALLAGRPPRYVQLATAAAPEGARSLRRWHDLGAEAAARIGAEQVVVPVIDRATAEEPAIAALIPGAGLIYLSGGNPAFLAETLRGTAVWAAILQAWQGGTALAGCSAGAMAMSASLPDIRHPWRPALPGLGPATTVEVLPHFDRFTARMPDLVLRRVAGAPEGVRVVGVDEDTAMVAWSGDAGAPATLWHVVGRQSVWLLEPGGRTEHPAGTTLRIAGTAS
jgi:cyanophycinase